MSVINGPHSCSYTINKLRTNKALMFHTRGYNFHIGLLIYYGVLCGVVFSPVIHEKTFCNINFIELENRPKCYCKRNTHVPLLLQSLEML